MSRFFAGLMAVSLATIHILVPCIGAIVLFLVSFVSRSKNLNCVLFLFILMSFVVVISISLENIKDIWGSFLFASFFFLASIYYRSHANLLNLAIIRDRDSDRYL